LGFSSKSPGWYGGRVHFRAKVIEQSRAKYKVVLERAELGPSCRFARRFGSTALLRIKIPPSMFKLEGGLIKFFLKPFVINGQVFRSFFAKDENVFMFRTNEVFNGSEIRTRSKWASGLSLLEFLNWHNSLELNKHQACSPFHSMGSFTCLLTLIYSYLDHDEVGLSL